MHPRIATIAAFSLAAHLTGAATRACVLEQGETRAVARVADSETLVLDDGRQVRLIGALGARHQDADADPEFWQPEADARAELERLVAGRTVQLGFAGRRVDRNGRVLAHVFVVDAGAHAEPAGPMPTGPQAGDAQPAAPSASDDPPGAWVQGHMIQTGHARAYVLPGNSACADALIALEGQARESGLGLWRNAAYAVRASDPPWPILSQRNRFQIVEGVVTSASDVRGQVYLNFGADWRTDFTASLKPIQRRALAALGTDAALLTGARVRVRGWITWRNGPYIEIADASEIEIIEPAVVSGDAPSPPAASAAARRQRRAAAPPGN